MWFRSIAQSVHTLVTAFYYAFGFELDEIDAALNKVPWVRDAWKDLPMENDINPPK